MSNDKRPAATYAEAVARFAELAALDDAKISSPGRSRFYGLGKRTERAVVLVHGLTNCPQQWELFAPTLVADGISVVVPRLPGHGHFNRATLVPKNVTRAEVLATVNHAVDIACGLGERVIVAGLSIGATIAQHVALDREDVAHNIALVPFFAVKRFNEAMTVQLCEVLDNVPNVQVPWDPFGDNASIPSYGYPKFSTRLLSQCLQVASDVCAAANERSPAGRTTMVLNAKEPACENTVSQAVIEHFERISPGLTRLIVWDDLPANHDLIDPTNPQARVDLVYPRLRELIDS